jgi:micrococcal nuclease
MAEKLRILIFAVVLLTAGFFAGRFFALRETPQLAVPVSGIGSAASVESTVNGEELYLVTRVIDGDTIEIEVSDPSTHSMDSGQAGAQGKDRVRYIGMDAPETVDPRKPVQCFGVEAARRNKELVEGKSVRLEKDVSERDKYGRLLRYVFLADGTFVNLELVKEGYAAASTFPPDVKYATMFAAAEKGARAAERGLWQACANADSRGQDADLRGQALLNEPTNNNCVIKGNISSNGEKIYHLPGCPYYDKTKIDEARGERWFCSEAGAVAAGWRKASGCP